MRLDPIQGIYMPDPKTNKASRTIKIVDIADLTSHSKEKVIKKITARIKVNKFKNKPKSQDLDDLIKRLKNIN